MCNEIKTIEFQVRTSNSNRWILMKHKEKTSVNSYDPFESSDKYASSHENTPNTVHFVWMNCILTLAHFFLFQTSSTEQKQAYKAEKSTHTHNICWILNKFSSSVIEEWGEKKKIVRRTGGIQNSFYLLLLSAIDVFTYSINVLNPDDFRRIFFVSRSCSSFPITEAIFTEKAILEQFDL